MDAVLTRRIGGGCHNASTLWPSTDEDRLSPEIGTFEHLDRGVEGVQVEVNDGTL
jgi:hypothetical protein